MGTFIDTMVMIGFFTLRLVVPMLLVVGVGYMLRRLDRKWEAELWAQAEAEKMTLQPVQQPMPQMEYPLPAAVLDIFGPPTWDGMRQCSTADSPDAPCWMARQQNEGQLPKECYNCAIYLSTQWSQQQWPQQMELPH